MTTDTQTPISPAEAIRKRVEEALAAEQVDLTRESGRDRTLRIIEQEIADAWPPSVGPVLLRVSAVDLVNL